MEKLSEPAFDKNMQQRGSRLSNRPMLEWWIGIFCEGIQNVPLIGPLRPATNIDVLKNGRYIWNSCEKKL